MAESELMKDSKYPLKYKIKAYLFTEREGDGYDTDFGMEDVNSFSVIRAPMTKTASFASITVNMKNDEYQSLEEKIRQNQFQLIEVNCTVVPNQDTTEHHKPYPIEDVFRKQYLVVHAEPLEPFIYQAPYIMVCLILVNPVLYYLQTTNGFNKILEDITSFDALKKFEDYCKETFGNKCFQFTKVGEDHEKNEFEYEQILTRNETDLMVPTVLIVNYKLWHTFGFYFLDDFRLDKEADGDICGWLINLGDLEKFEQKDQYDSESSDVAMANKFVRDQPITDHFNVLFQEKPSVIAKGYDIQFGFKKAEDQKKVPQIKQKAKQSEYSSARKAKIIQSEASTKEVDPTEHTIVFAPDKPEDGMKRFYKVQEQLRQKVHSIETYYMHDCHLDFVQFGFRYNMRAWDQKKYLHVPICICHTFVRDTGRVPIFTHNMRYQMLKYKDPKGE